MESSTILDKMLQHLRQEAKNLVKKYTIAYLKMQRQGLGKIYGNLGKNRGKNQYGNLGKNFYGNLGVNLGENYQGILARILVRSTMEMLARDLVRITTVILARILVVQSRQTANYNSC